jgi:pyruvate formate lyase activating enzyme
MQHRFAVRLFDAVKQMGVHTAIETNGYYGENLSDAELELIDLVILDMKAHSLDRHKIVTGIGNADVLEFCDRLAALRRPMWLRYVLVPGLTDLPEEMAAVAAFGASLGVVERAEILPFHQLGKYKWERLGVDYALADTVPPTNEGVATAVAIFREAGLKAD